MFQIIPAIDIINGKCVRLQQGDFERETVYSDSPAEMGKKWEAAGAPRIHLVDLDGARTGALSNLKSVKAICDAVACPCELGGGIRTRDDIRRILDAGVDRVILGTVLVKDPQLASKLTDEFGPDRIIAGVDARNGKIAVQGWQNESSIPLHDFIERLADSGIRRIIYTDISNDGMLTGVNIASTVELCDLVPGIQFIASGGIGTGLHVQDLCNLCKKNLEGVIVGKALYDGRVSYRELLDLTSAS